MQRHDFCVAHFSSQSLWRNKWKCCWLECPAARNCVPMHLLTWQSFHIYQRFCGYRCLSTKTVNWICKQLLLMWNFRRSCCCGYRRNGRAFNVYVVAVWRSVSCHRIHSAPSSSSSSLLFCFLLIDSFQYRHFVWSTIVSKIWDIS